MKVAIISYPRKVSYVQQTVSSMLETDSSVHPGDIAVSFDADEVAATAGAGTMLVGTCVGSTKGYAGARQTANYVRALRWAAQANELCVLCEDDIECAYGWARRAQLLALKAKALSKKDGDDFVITLLHFYQITDFGPRMPVTRQGDPNPTSLMRWKYPNGFYGTQAVVMPPDDGP